MRLLLDTHAFLWWFLDDSRLSKTVHGVIADEASEVLVSAASAWEIATKHRIGKLAGAGKVLPDIARAIADQGFGSLPISVADGARAGALPGHRRDPFDRILIAQALTRNIVLVSNEALFDRYAAAAAGRRRTRAILALNRAFGEGSCREQP